MKYLVAICLLLSTCISVAQTGLADTTNKYRKVMIVPFEPTRYLCGIQRDLAETSNMTHEQIVQHFRYNLSASLQDEFLHLYHCVSLIHYSDTLKDLYDTYARVKYKFEIFEEEEVEDQNNNNGLKGLIGKKKKKAKQEERGGIENGQIVSNRSQHQKFAKVILQDEEWLKYLGNKYGADLFVFITELDIENDISDPIAFLNNDYKRFLKVNYCILDIKGKYLSEGIITTTFPNTVNDVQIITKDYFPEIAKALAAKLPQPFTPRIPKDEVINPTEKLRKEDE
jgi:hypothetical protein